MKRKMVKKYKNQKNIWYLPENEKIKIGKTFSCLSEEIENILNFLVIFGK